MAGDNGSGKPLTETAGPKRLFQLKVWDDRRFALQFYSLDSETFRYAHELVTEFPERRFNRDLKCWLIPWTEANLDYLAANFRSSEYDLDADAQIVHDYHMKSRVVLDQRESRRWDYAFNDKVPEVDFDFHTEPYGHQQTGLDAVHGAEFFGLLFETGTGKTKVLVDEFRWAADERAATGRGGLKVLVVCPRTLRKNWLKEIRKHLPPDYDYWSKRIRGGNGGLRDMLAGVQSDAPLKVWAISFDSVDSHLDALQKMKFHVCVLDESTHIKNSGAKRTGACWKLGETTDRRFILTGTPVANTILDLWSQFQFLRPGILGYDSFSAFKRRYADLRRTEAGYDQIKGWKRLDELKERMAKCSFVVKKSECLDLPPKNYTTRHTEMSKQQEALYKEMIQFFVASLDEDFHPDGTAKAQIILTKFLRLSQICSGFLKTESGKEVRITGADGKREALGEILDSVDPDHKIIVWARFRHDVEYISSYLTKRRIAHVRVTGGQSENERDRSVQSFNWEDEAARPLRGKDRGARVLIGEPGCGGMGLTLLGSEKRPCTDVVYWNNDFSLLKRVQSEDRCHRIGLKRPVTYHDLVIEGTIEERIAEMLQAKKELGEYMKDYGSIRSLLLDEQKEDEDDA